MLNDGNVHCLNRLLCMTLSGVLSSGVFFSGIVFGADKAPAESLHTYSGPFLQIARHQVPAPAFRQDVQVQVFLPPGYSVTAKVPYPSLYLNDGQDAEAVALAETLGRLYAEHKISPVIVVAVSMLPDRMGTYGYSDGRQSLTAQTRYGPVGAQAHAYSDWLAHNLVPFIDSHYRTTRKPQARTMLGWSLGAANAFNVAWNYPGVFGRIGGFSPSFWLSAKPGDASTAVVQSLITKTPMPKNFSMWLAAGSAEETDDRDGDGVIDVIDDSQNVIAVLQEKNANVALPALHIYPGGQHNQGTWKIMLPDFLLWAYPIKP